MSERAPGSQARSLNPFVVQPQRHLAVQWPVTHHGQPQAFCAGSARTHQVDKGVHQQQGVLDVRLAPHRANDPVPFALERKTHRQGVVAGARAKHARVHAVGDQVHALGGRSNLRTLARLVH